MLESCFHISKCMWNADIRYNKIILSFYLQMTVSSIPLITQYSLIWSSSLKEEIIRKLRNYWTDEIYSILLIMRMQYIVPKSFPSLILFD